MSEPRAPYGPPAQAAPPDLSRLLQPALERLGFTVERYEASVLTLLLARWPEPGTTRVFGLAYSHSHPSSGPHLSYVSLEVARGVHCECLLTDTHVRKLAEVRQLLLNNRRYKTARLAALATGTLLPAPAPPTT